ncbi:hypothetical protein [Lentzea atacamensis]|uniref:hypothetical protein n=1 Tax=Lentzea atacamensis TaxID=531938 RepID=UPI0014751CF8|nr:hypothetical protein [Lentzea atacamensis]
MGRELPPGGPVAGMSAVLERRAWRAELRRLGDDQSGEALEGDVSPRAEHE